MKLKKMGSSGYLMVKLKSREKKYLEGFSKSESIRTVKNTDDYFSQMIAVHIKAVYVMQTALTLKKEGLISAAGVSSIFKELDNTISSFEKTVNRNFIRLNDLIERKNKKVKKRKS